MRREHFLKLYIRMFAALLSLRPSSVSHALRRFARLNYPPPPFSSETQCSASIRRRASCRALLQSLAASNGRLEISLCVTHLSESLAFCCGALLHRVRLSMRASSLQVLLSVSMQGEVGVGLGVEESGVSRIKKRGGDLNFFS